MIKRLRDWAKAQKAAGKKNSDELQTVPGWELTVGIEIHAQLNTPHKLFSSATPPLPSDQPNTHTAFFDLAIPGSQPIFQREAILPALRAALALKCKISPVSRWDRKHYFWWDQPNGYQITQFYEPFAKGGRLYLHDRDGIAAEDGKGVSIEIRQIQMEQDTGKTLAGSDGLQRIDFNRAGVPLIEIITQPQIHHPRTAAAFVRKVQAYLRSVDACVSGMEAGGLRADVNVSVRRTGEKSLGQRTEIKNLSSFRAVEDAIIAERDRQIAVLEQGGTVLGETRGWAIGATETTRLREKEGEVDYRYMPDPDLPPLMISKPFVKRLGAELSMLPDQEIEFLWKAWGLPPKDIMALMDTGKLEYFYEVVRRLKRRLNMPTLVSGQLAPEARDKQCMALACNWVIHELGRLTSERNVSADGSVETLEIKPDGTSSRVPAHHLGDIVFFVDNRSISKQVAKELLFSVFRGDVADHPSPSGYSSIEEAIKKEDLWLRELSKSEHENLAAKILTQEQETLETKFRPHFVEEKSYPEGQLMRFVGMMMKAAPVGAVDPQMAARVLRKAIEAKYQTQWS